MNTISIRTIDKIFLVGSVDVPVVVAHWFFDGRGVDDVHGWRCEADWLFLGRAFAGVDVDVVVDVDGGIHALLGWAARQQALVFEEGDASHFHQFGT